MLDPTLSCVVVWLSGSCDLASLGCCSGYFTVTRGLLLASPPSVNGSDCNFPLDLRWTQESSGGQRSPTAFLFSLAPILRSRLTESLQALLSGALHVLRVTRAVGVGQIIPWCYLTSFLDVVTLFKSLKSPLCSPASSLVVRKNGAIVLPAVTSLRAHRCSVVRLTVKMGDSSGLGKSLVSGSLFISVLPDTHLMGPLRNAGASIHQKGGQVRTVVPVV